MIIKWTPNQIKKLMRCKNNYELLQKFPDHSIAGLKRRKREFKEPLIEPVEKIGFIDIESESLDADYGIIFSYCILDNDSKKIYRDTINKNDVRKWGKEGKEDTRLIKNLVKDMSHFTRLCGHFAMGFDYPFMRSRAVICGVKFPEFGTYFQTDTWAILKKKFKLSHNTLENGTRQLLGVTRKNHLTLPIKHGCLRGEKWALNKCLEHNIFDVQDTHDLYHKIHWSMKKIKSYI